MYVSVALEWSNLASDNKAHGANIGLIWGRQDPGGPHVGPMNFAIWGTAENSRVWIIPYYEMDTPMNEM